MSNNKNSILEEAANELQSIVEAAKKTAKDNLAKELPDKFDVLLNEELKKLSSKESVKESVKDKAKKEPVVEGKKADKKKESINEMDMREFSMQEVEDAFDQANGEEEFSVVPDEEAGEESTVDDIASAIDSIEDMNNQAVEEAKQDDPFTRFKELAEQMGQMVKEMETKKMHEEYGAQFESDMTNIYGEGYAQSLGEETCSKLKEAYISKKMGEPFGEKSMSAPNVNESKTKPFEEKGKSLSEDKDQPFEDKADPSKEQGKSIDEMHEKVPRGATAPADKGHNTTPAGINEEEEEDDDDKVEVEIEVGGEDEKEEEREEKEMDENLTNTNAAQRKVQGGHSPNIDVAGKHRNPRTRPSMRSTNETYEKRMKSLIEENKKLTKKINEAENVSKKAEQLVENYKNHLEKYRTQLREMAVFNTNLANVNNLLVNEQLALTANDKLNIINKFKSINNIDESDKVYGEVLNEMKEGKKTISENVETKVSKSVGESSKQKIDEAIERTAYENNEHVNKIKKLMAYVDKRK